MFPTLSHPPYHFFIVFINNFLYSFNSNTTLDLSPFGLYPLDPQTHSIFSDVVPLNRSTPKDENYVFMCACVCPYLLLWLNAIQMTCLNQTAQS